MTLPVGQKPLSIWEFREPSKPSNLVLLPVDSSWQQRIHKYACFGPNSPSMKFHPQPKCPGPFCLDDGMAWPRVTTRLVAQDPDGNCFFRSVSYAAFGDPAHHNIVRQAGYRVMREQWEKKFRNLALWCSQVIKILKDNNR